MWTRVSVMLVQSAVLTDECEIIIMSSLCLNKTNTGKKRRGGIKTKPRCQLNKWNCIPTSCVEDTVDMTVSVRSTKIRSYLIPAVVVGEASQTFLWLATRHGTVMLGLSLECLKRNWLLLTKLLRMNYPAALWFLLCLHGLFSDFRNVHAMVSSCQKLYLCKKDSICNFRCYMSNLCCHKWQSDYVTYSLISWFKVYEFVSFSLYKT